MHYSGFYKHLLVCDSHFGPEFLHEIQAHYDNLEPEMFIENFQMPMYSSVSKEEKVTWLKQWNESRVLREANKFPKHGFLNT